MSDVTRLLDASQQGDPKAAEELLPLVYQKLRQLAATKMARENPGHTLQPTALVHEAWLCVAGNDGQAQFQNRAHFFGAAAEAMRRILIDRARRKFSAKHGANAGHIDANDIEIAAPIEKEDEPLAMHDALDALAAHDPRKAELVKLRYFAGFTIEDGLRGPRHLRPHREARLDLRESVALPQDCGGLNRRLSQTGCSGQ